MKVEVGKCIFVHLAVLVSSKINTVCVTYQVLLIVYHIVGNEATKGCNARSHTQVNAGNTALKISIITCSHKA